MPPLHTADALLARIAADVRNTPDAPATRAGALGAIQDRYLAETGQPLPLGQADDALAAELGKPRRRTDQERARDKLTVPETAKAAWRWPRSILTGETEVIQEISAPVVAAAYRAQAWAMLKGLDSTGTWYRPVLRCAVALFDAAHDLDGQRADDEPTEV